MIKYDQWYYFPTKRDQEKFLRKVIPELYMYMNKDKQEEIFVLFMEKALIRVAPDKTLRYRTARSSRFDEEMGVIAYKDTADSTLEKEENNQENSKMGELKACACSTNFKTPAIDLIKKLRKEEVTKMDAEIAKKQEAFIEKTAVGKALIEAAKVISNGNPDTQITWKSLFLPHYLTKEEQIALNKLAEERIEKEAVIDEYYNEIYTLLAMAECYEQVEKILKEYKLLKGPRK